MAFNENENVFICVCALMLCRCMSASVSCEFAVSLMHVSPSKKACRCSRSRCGHFILFFLKKINDEMERRARRNSAKENENLLPDNVAIVNGAKI